MWSIVKLLFYILVFGAFALFIAFNSSQKVDVIFFFKLVEQVPLGVVMSLSFFAGTLVSLPFFVVALVKTHQNSANKLSKNNLKHKEIENKLTNQLKQKKEDKKPGDSSTPQPINEGETQE